MVSLYDITVPVFIAQIKILLKLLEKGSAHVGPDNASKLLDARLVEDMKPLSFQIQRVSDTSKGFVVRLGNVENEVWDDNETTLPELQARLQKTIKFLEAVDRSAIDGKEDAEINQPGPGGVPMKVSGSELATKLALPNFYFHLVTAYGLLRKEGVPIGKADYFGRV